MCVGKCSEVFVFFPFLLFNLENIGNICEHDYVDTNTCSAIYRFIFTNIG